MYLLLEFTKSIPPSRLCQFLLTVSENSVHYNSKVEHYCIAQLSVLYG